MLERLQTKWKVNGTQLFLVLCVFAIGGSATGFIGKIIMNRLPVERGLAWTIVYILLVTLIWPMSVLLVSIPFGQFHFFLQYLKRMGYRLGLIKKDKPQSSANQLASSIHHAGFETLQSSSSGRERITRLAIFASGTGSNAQMIITHFKNHPSIQVELIACNKPGAGVLTIAAAEKITTLLLEKEKFFRGNSYVDELRSAGIDFIILAGFLWKMPLPLIETYRNKIVNIHPALLPKYGGKGMYGSRVHEAVIDAGDEVSGITIHYVDEHYDNGDIIFQERVNINENETPESLANKIHELEHSNYPRIIEQLILQPNGS